MADGSQAELEGPKEALSAREVIRSVRRMMDAGNLLAGYDLATEAIEAGLAEPEVRYLAVSALASIGSSKRALAQYRALDVEAIGSAEAFALKGRILLDRAFAGRLDRRRERFLEAAEAYSAAHRRGGGHSAAVYASAAMLLAGDARQAAELARLVLADPKVQAGADHAGLASGLQACLLLGDAECARGWLARMREDAEGSAEERAATAALLRLIEKARPDLGGLVGEVRVALRNPPVLVYSGHMFLEGDPLEAELAARVAQVIAETGPAAAVGALACGADIVIAEAALAARVALHVVLPFDRNAYLEKSVVPGGESWRKRFIRCFEAAETRSFVSDGPYVGDPSQFTFGTEVARGLAVIRAKPTDAEPIQLSVMQAGAQRLAAGTAYEADLWQRLGYRSIVIDPGPVNRNIAKKMGVVPINRDRQTLLFADFCGFSRLAEAHLPLFVREVLGRAAAVLDRAGDAVLARNSWGDAVYAVIGDPIAAAGIALDIQEALRALPPQLTGAGGAGMRIGIHHGPVYRDVDPVLGRVTFFGREVTRAARIEPITPIGEVYATLAFAAILALRAPDRFALDYVGRIKLAKEYDELAMFRLSRAVDE